MNQINVLMSGGARGSDSYWGYIASVYQHNVIHFSFKGHKADVPADSLYRLSEIELECSNEHVDAANIILKRRVPKYKPWMYNLLRRNWYQVNNSTLLFAVGTTNNKAIIRNNNIFNSNCFQKIDTDDDLFGVDGGTAWAIQMFYNKQQLSKIFFYDQIKNKILFNSPTQFNFWEEIGFMENNNIIINSDNTIDKPSGIYTGIGTRDLTDTGKKFIQSVYNF